MARDPREAAAAEMLQRIQTMPSQSAAEALVNPAQIRARPVPEVTQQDRADAMQQRRNALEVDLRALRTAKEIQNTHYKEHPVGGERSDRYLQEQLQGALTPEESANHPDRKRIEAEIGFLNDELDLHRRRQPSEPELDPTTGEMVVRPPELPPRPIVSGEPMPEGLEQQVQHLQGLMGLAPPALKKTFPKFDEQGNPAELPPLPPEGPPLPPPPPKRGIPPRENTNPPWEEHYAKYSSKKRGK